MEGCVVAAIVTGLLILMAYGLSHEHGDKDRGRPGEDWSKRLARTQGGHVVNGVVILSRRGCELRVDGSPALNGGMNVSVRPSLQWGGRLHVYPANVQVLDAHLGTRDIDVGDAAFDAAYAIHASSDEFAMRVMGRAVREAMREVSTYGPPVLTVGPTGLQLQVAMDDDNERAQCASALVACAERLADALARATPDTGSVRFVESATRSEGLCPVCGTALGAGGVRCAACATPHHADCWSFNRRCATYACGCATSRPVQQYGV